MEKGYTNALETLCNLIPIRDSRAQRQYAITKLTIHADCGNAPRKLVLRDLNIAFAHSDLQAILDHFTDNIRWQIIRQTNLRSKETVRTALKAMKDTVTTELLIHSIFTHRFEVGPKTAQT